MIDSARLNVRVELMKVKSGIGSISQDINQYESFKSVWAEIKPLRGREYFESIIAKDEATYRITIRYIKDIDATMYVKYKKGDKIQYFNIQSVINVNNLNETLELMCKEYVGETPELEKETEKGWWEK